MYYMYPGHSVGTGCSRLDSSTFYKEKSDEFYDREYNDFMIKEHLIKITNKIEYVNEKKVSKSSMPIAYRSHQ